MKHGLIDMIPKPQLNPRNRRPQIQLVQKNNVRPDQILKKCSMFCSIILVKSIMSSLPKDQVKNKVYFKQELECLRENVAVKSVKIVGFAPQECTCAISFSFMREFLASNIIPVVLHS